MTLNLTLVSPNLIVQTSDFRLTAGREIRSHTAQKQTVLQYRDWSGLVCYTGIAQWGDHDTAAWLDQVLSHPAGQRSPQDIADTLARKGRAWLRRIPEEHRVHAFTLAAFEQGRPTVYLVSNVMRPDGSWKPARPAAFSCYRLQPEQPWCLVTGYASAVDSGQKASLEALMEAGTSPAGLRRLAAEASRAAAGRAENTVSEECVAAHLTPGGAGESEVFGNLPARFLPSGIINGRLVAPRLVVDEGDGSRRLVGAEWHAEPGGAVLVMTGGYRRLDQQQGAGWRDTDD
ncbi:hypothetical protein P3T37_007428 [Kitasatospora sp. MAA4]|uniref:hypothetical protein n=1 Tax=Kitasatospora sp. MAA4 TaxID=3035093 RepID=UPI002475E0E1|nr:hypothetical protein [Kitasatospora sp. MAA4]MDH6137985.1 hypothetical protein [Kitasatospora sp. MAA4]